MGTREEGTQKVIASFSGIVQHGDGRGKQLGFPTANTEIASPEMQEVEDGVYISVASISGLSEEVDAQDLPALTFIGRAETFEGTQRRAETYILDFDTDFYGKLIDVRLMHKLRGSKKFSSVEELIDAMQKDEQQAHNFFDNH